MGSRSLVSEIKNTPQLHLPSVFTSKYNWHDGCIFAGVCGRKLSVASSYNENEKMDVSLKDALRTE